MWRNGFRVLVVLVAMAAGAARAQDQANNKAISDFFGTFEGRTLFPMGEQGNRGLKVRISPFDETGFTVLWETTIQKGKSGAERKTTSVNFEPSDRPEIYRAVYPPGGEPRLLDGDPFTWASLSESTLTVHVVTIVDGGDYVMQSYYRTLTAGGMKLDFERIRDGVVERQLKGNLTRVEPPAAEPPAAEE